MSDPFGPSLYRRRSDRGMTKRPFLGDEQGGGRPPFVSLCHFLINFRIQNEMMSRMALYST